MFSSIYILRFSPMKVIPYPAVSVYLLFLGGVGVGGCLPKCISGLPETSLIPKFLIFQQQRDWFYLKKKKKKKN